MTLFIVTSVTCTLKLLCTQFLLSIISFPSCTVPTCSRTAAAPPACAAEGVVADVRRRHRVARSRSKSWTYRSVRAEAAAHAAESCLSGCCQRSLCSKGSRTGCSSRAAGDHSSGMETLWGYRRHSTAEDEGDGSPGRGRGGAVRSSGSRWCCNCRFQCHL